MDIRVDAARVVGDLDVLAGFSDAAAPAVTRVVFSEQDRRAREWLAAHVRGGGVGDADGCDWEFFCAVEGE